MASNRLLAGARIHLAGSIPDAADPEQTRQIETFVAEFAVRVLLEGGTILHGSHPTLIGPLQAAMEQSRKAGGVSRDQITLVRASAFKSEETENEQRAWAKVELIPMAAGVRAKAERGLSAPGGRAPADQGPAAAGRVESLVEMREWLAERCDAVVAVGGKDHGGNWDKAGVARELEAGLERGRPGFVAAGFGGGIAGYLRHDGTVLSRLRNGLSDEANGRLAASADHAEVIGQIVEQLGRLPLTRPSAPLAAGGRAPPAGEPASAVGQGRMFRILALDGGGLRGAFTAAVLAAWDEALPGTDPGKLIDHFDLVAGTSTGSILAVGLALGKRPRELVDFYRNHGPTIFPRRRWKLRSLFAPKYDAAPLREQLETVFGKTTMLGACRRRLVIPVIRAEDGAADVITTRHSPDRRARPDFTAASAALASSSAPTYFDAARAGDGRYLDGGLWANNPVLAAVAEAVFHLNVPLHRIDVLSVGTIESKADFTKSLDGGILRWARPVSDLFFAAQERGASMLADRLLSKARHLRVNDFSAKPIKMDDVKVIGELCRLGSVVGSDDFRTREVRSRFLDGFHAPPW